MSKLGSTSVTGCPECGTPVLIKNSRRNPSYSTMVACVRKMQRLLEEGGAGEPDLGIIGLGQLTRTAAIPKGGGAQTVDPTVRLLRDSVRAKVAPSRSKPKSRAVASQAATPVSAIKGLTLNSPTTLPEPRQEATPAIRAGARTRSRRTLVSASGSSLEPTAVATPPKKQRTTTTVTAPGDRGGTTILLEAPLSTLSPSSLVIATSGLSADQRMIVESSYRQIPRARISLVSGMGSRERRRITHLVTSTNAAGLAPRTAKYLRGVLWGLPIVSYDWYLASLAEGPVPVEPYLIRGDDVIGVPTEAVARSMAAHQRGDPPLLAGHSFAFSVTAPIGGSQQSSNGGTGTGTPTKSELISLIEAGGGKVVTLQKFPLITGGEGRGKGKGREREQRGRGTMTRRNSSDTTNLIFLHGTHEIVDPIDGFQCRPYSWLFDCISHYRIL